MKRSTIYLGLVACLAFAFSTGAVAQKGGGSHGGGGGGGSHGSGGSHGGGHQRSGNGSHGGGSHSTGGHKSNVTPHAYGGVGFGQTNAKRLAPAVNRGVNAPSKAAFVNPHGPTRTNNFPKPQYASGYAFTNRAEIERNYGYDAGHYASHVANFHCWQSPSWGGHWRYGYWAHGSFGWGFGFYVFSPFYAACVASPWYYDSWCPPYILASQVVYDPGYVVKWPSGSNYDWVNGPNAPLNAACGEIVNAFTTGNADQIGNLIGGGEVAVFSEGQYEYSLNSSDFIQMFKDNLQSTQTASFTITGVHLGVSTNIYNPSGEPQVAYHHAVVHATHVFQDPNGGTDTVYQKYRLQYLDDAYVITDFMTSHTPI